MKKKLLLLIVAIMVLAGVVGVLAGCQPPTAEGEMPVPWQRYIDEIVDYNYNTFRKANDNFSFGLNLAMQHMKEGKQTLYEGKFELIQDRKNFANSGFLLEIYSQEENQDKQLKLRIAFDNEKMYLYARDDNGANDIKYHFPNTPLFELYRLDLADPTLIRGQIAYLLEKIATNCDVNADKSIYTIDIDMEKYVNSVQSEIKQIFSVIPQPILDEINLLFNTNTSAWEKVIKDTVGKMDVHVSASGKITDIGIYDIKNYSDDSSRIVAISASGMLVSNITDGTIEVAPPQEDMHGYVTTKILTAAVNGTIDLLSSTNKRTAISYGLKLNTSLDLLHLANNKFDFASLDDDNYLHLRIEHICDNNCSSYCDVQQGNKLSPGIGAMIDIAFSPKYFGTHYVYVSISAKQLLGENTIKAVAGDSAGLASSFLPQYTLLTLDTSAYAMLNGDDSGLKLIQFLLGLNSNLSIHDDYTDIDIYKMLKLAGLNDDSLVKTMLNVAEFNIDVARINYSSVQYGHVVDYDIYNEAIHIIDRNHGETKQYFMLGNMPSLEWDFYDKEVVEDNGQLFDVHNMYYSSNDELMYSSNVPISATELDNLGGCYINYTMTNIYQEGEATVRKTKVLGVIGMDTNIIGQYQKVYLKVELPSRWFALSVLGSMKDVVNKYLYAVVETHIKLTSIAANGLTISRTDYENGKLVNDYRLFSETTRVPKMILGQVTIKYEDDKKSTKKVELLGQCNAIQTSYGATGSIYYKPIQIGATEVTFVFAGKVAKFKVNIIPPDDIIMEQKESKSTILKLHVIYDDYDLVLFNAKLQYGEDTVIYQMSMNEIYLDGMPLNKSSMYWTSFFKSENEIAVTFNIDRKFEYEARLFGMVANTQLIATSKETEPSKYALTNGNYSQSVISETYVTRTHNLMNTFHGSSGYDDAKLSIVVQKGNRLTANSSPSYSTIEPGEGSYHIQEVTYSNLQYDLSNPVPIIIPKSIYKKIPIKVIIKIVQPGEYRISIYLKSGAKTIAVIQDNIVVNAPE